MGAVTTTREKVMAEPTAIDQIRKLGEELLELIFPPVCLLCERPGREVICASCREQFALIEPPYCVRCGRPLPESAATATVCGQCRQSPPQFDGARAVGLHSATLREAVLRFKFARRQRLVKPLAELLAERVGMEQTAPAGLPWENLTGVVPVVLHPRRRNWRGFDQAVLLSRRLAKLIDLPCREQVLVRSKDTAPQIGLTPPQRRDNMKDAFAVPQPEVVAGESLLLIDDVYTTGSTLNEAAKVLHRAGAKSVWALTITCAMPSWHPQVGQQLGDEEDLQAAERVGI